MTDGNLQVYGGRWHVIEEVGRGGQGVVYEVEDLTNPITDEKVVENLGIALRQATAAIQTQHSEAACRDLIQLIKTTCSSIPRQRFALKKLLPNDRPVKSTAALDRIKTEIQTMRQVRHPSLIELRDESDDHSWFVTDLFSNGTLARSLESFKGQAIESLKAIRPVVEAISFLHQSRIVHRDVKPENMFIARTGALILGDCGLAFLRDGQDRVTETFENVGSRDWMPAWAMGQRLSDVHPSCDVFSLGKVLWAMVAGKPVLQLWYHRKPQFSLERMFPGDESIPFIQEILDETVVENREDCLIDANGLLAKVDWTIEALNNNVRIVNGDLLLKCLVCGKGEYHKIADHDGTSQHNFGLNVVGQPKFRIFVCAKCGHTQLFYSIDGLSMSAWHQ